MTLFPCLNLQQSLNTVVIRQMLPRGPFESELRSAPRKLPSGPPTPLRERLNKGLAQGEME
jgi:hypothetical protein